MQKNIIGAGLAGLIAACHFKDAHIFEGGGFIEQHKALLRFRDKSVSDLIGIPFKEVTVHKEISYLGKAHHQPTIAMANMYARKVSGLINGRSIWNLDTVKRYVAPEKLYGMLVERHQTRIHWNQPFGSLEKDSGVTRGNQLISTIPLPSMLKACRLQGIDFEFQKSKIEVVRYRLPEGTEVYQTVYFPDSSLRLFRASITGDLLILESMSGQPVDEFCWPMSKYDEIVQALQAFGLHEGDVEFIDTVDQKYGKIIELPRAKREAILYELTRDFGVFSIGRFATWRNILLDDVAKDIQQVEKLMNASAYGRDLVLAGR